MGLTSLDMCSLVSEVRHCLFSPAPMSSTQRLLDIPPINLQETSLPSAPSPYEESPDVAQVTAVEPAALLPPTSPTPPVLPTSSRSMRGQSSRSFSKTRDSVMAVQGSSATPIIASSATQALQRVGMAPAGAGESANAARARLNENEARLAEFVTSLEERAVKQDREQSQRLQELTLLVREGRAACEQQVHSPALQTSDSITSSSIVDNPVVLQLHSVVVEDRLRITELVNEIRHLRADIDRQRTRTASPALPFIPQLPAPLPSRPKRSLEDRSEPPRAKRLRTESQQHPDVLYGPVDREGNPRTIANAVLGLIPGLQQKDVYTAKYAHNQPGILSLRFRNHVVAERFIDFIDKFPILEGQTAIAAGPVGTPSISASGLGGENGPSSGLTPQEIIRGVVKSPQRR